MSTQHAEAPPASEQRLAVLLATAMFVLVVDTSLMNVSIAAVVDDLDTTVSGVQSAIALEALVSAAFILIGSKVGDLIGRKRAYVLGLLAYAVGALAMAFAQSLTAIVIFWAIVGGFGASLLLPAMQSLIHSNFEARPRSVRTPWSVPRQPSPPPSGHSSVASSRPTCPGGSRSCSRSSSIADRAVRDPPRPRRPVHRGSKRRRRGRGPSRSLGMGGVVLGILVWQEGGESVAALLVIGVVAMSGVRPVADAAEAAGQADPPRPRSVRVTATSGSASPSRRSSRSPWAA